jgi:hypothetical protein
MYERAVALAPESALARFKRVRLVLAFKQFQVRPLSLSPFFFLAVLTTWQQLAESDLLALKHLAPSEPNVHYLLGKLYKQLGAARRPEMLVAFATAQDLEPRLARCVLSFFLLLSPRARLMRLFNARSVIREQIERPTDEAHGGNGMDVDDSRTESSSVA